MSTPNVFPSIRYADAPAVMRWLTEAFGAVVHASFEGPGHTIAHAELRFGDGIVMVGSTAPPSENPWTRARTGVYVAVADADAHHARAVRAGATILRPLADTDYGAREYTAGDLEGHLWSFGTYRPSRAIRGWRHHRACGALRRSRLRDAGLRRLVAGTPHLERPDTRRLCRD